MTRVCSKYSDISCRAYDALYLEDAMSCLACFFDYAVWDYGAEGSEIATIFASSQLARQFEAGAPWVVSGRSGIELFWDMCREFGYEDEQAMIEQGFRPDRTPDTGRDGSRRTSNGGLRLRFVRFSMSCRSMRSSTCTTRGTRHLRSV